MHNYHARPASSRRREFQPLPGCGLGGTLSCQLEKGLSCRFILRVRAAETSQKKCFCHCWQEGTGAEGTVHCFLAVSPGRYQGFGGSFVRWRRGGGGLPVAGTAEAFSFGGLTGFKAFPTWGPIPTSGVNEWSPSLAPPGPLVPREGTDLPHPIPAQLPP